MSDDIERLVHASMGKDFKRVEPQPDLSDPIEVMARAMWRGPLPLDSHECRQFARLAADELAAHDFCIVRRLQLVDEIAEAYEAGRHEVKSLVENCLARK